MATCKACNDKGGQQVGLMSGPLPYCPHCGKKNEYPYWGMLNSYGSYHTYGRSK